MSRIPLLGGAYQSRSLIASAQRCVNLYPEKNPPESSPTVPVTHYPTPGLRPVSQAPVYGRVRAMYRSSKGALYIAVNGPSATNIYAVSDILVWTLIGTVPLGQSPVVFSDNGTVIVIVDGTATSYAIDIETGTFGTISSTNFFGGTWVTYLDTYFVFNNPTTNQFYISLSNVTFGMLIGPAGSLLHVSVTSEGSGYIDGTYTNVFLTGGSGAGATATFVVSAGTVQSVKMTAGGTGYASGDILGVNATDLGGAGSGFSGSANIVATNDGFDSLDIAAKTGASDPLVAVSAIHGELWLIGELTTEIWSNTGASDFTFGRIQGAFVDHGCAAPYSLSQQDIFLFWLAQDKQGKAVIVRTEGYGVKRISTHAIEADIQSYSTVSDAIGYCHQIDGHAFYVITFPSANKTWAYELATGQWHERASINQNGVLGRHKGNAFAFAYGQNFVGDYLTGAIYVYDQNYFLDGTLPIPRIRTFPHIVNNGDRVQYNQFTADIEVGQTGGILTDQGWDISLRWSDTRGASYGNAVVQSMGAGGELYSSPQWGRLGYARDRVFEISWSAPVKTSLNGAWVDYKAMRT